MTLNPGPYTYPLAAVLIRLGLVRTAGQQRRVPDDDREWNPGRCWRWMFGIGVPLWALIILAVRWWLA